MDIESEEILRRLDLPATTVVPLADLEAFDRALLGTKTDRTQVEYCWTATPAVCRYVLNANEEITEVTYLDADLMFFSDPEPIFDEFGAGSVLIVPHRYAPEHQYKEPTSGSYNVEWLTFRRDEQGLAALNWWHDRCIEWCYFRWEEGKLGDQKYLDEFPSLFEGVHVLEHPGGGLAPWNVTAHTLAEAEGVEVDGRPLVFYHYHSLRLYRPTLLSRFAGLIGDPQAGIPPGWSPWRTNYPVSDAERRLIWAPYLREYSRAAADVEAVAPGSLRPLPSLPSKEFLRPSYRRARRTAGRLVHSVRQLTARPFVLGNGMRYRDSWQSSDVARQMIALTDQQLEHPEQVEPYRAFLQLLPSLLARQSLPRPATFLDIGCGVGAYGELLERYAPGRFAYVGADYSDEILEVARRRWPTRQFERRDILEAGALDGFDVVFASALLDVLPEPEAALDVLLAADASFVILHRQQIDERRPRVEVVPGYEGQRTYRSYITPGQLATAAERHGRLVSATVEVEGTIKSFLLTPAC